MPFLNRADSFSARFSLWEDVHFSQGGSSGTASTAIVLSQMSDRRKLGLMGILRLGTQGALGLSVMVLAISAVLYQMYLFRKGDVE